MKEGRPPTSDSPAAGAGAGGGGPRRHLGSCYLPELGAFCAQGPADELSAVIEFPCQREMCHYTHVPMVYVHYPAAPVLLLTDAVGGNRLMFE